MSVLWWLLVAVLIIVGLWAAILLANRRYNLKKRGIAVSPGVVMWYTKRGVGFIDRVAMVSKGGWCAFGTLAAAIGIFMMIFVFVNLVLNIVIILTQPAKALPGVALPYPGLIPGLTIIAWLIAISTLFIVHEFSHGFLLRAQGLKVESVGGMFLIAIFGAFVEPNKKEIEKASTAKRLRMFAAGSMANFVLAFVCLGIILLLLTPKPGVYALEVRKGGPSENFLAPGMRILSLDNMPLESWEDYYKFLENVKPGDNVLITTKENGAFTVTADNYRSENRGDLGIFPMSAIPRSAFLNPLFGMAVMTNEFTGGWLFGHTAFHPHIYWSAVPWAIIDILKWIFVFNLGVGLFNLLPAVPFDGGYMMQAILERRISKKKAKRVVRILSYTVLVLILMNFTPALMR